MESVNVESPVQEGNVIIENNQQAAIPVSVNPFDDEVWKETPDVPIVEQKTDTSISDNKNQDIIPAAETVTEPDDTIVDSDIYLEQNFGWKTTADGLKELEELRKLKQGQEFSNEDSKRLYDAIVSGKEDEVYSLLHKKKELSQLDELKAEDVIRMNIKYSNPHYKSADIEDVFEEQYAKPAKPSQSEDEEDVDYSVRVQKWEQQIQKIDRKLERDAFAAKEQLAKYKNDLALPELAKQDTIQNTGIDPEALNQFKEYREMVFKKLPDEIKSFDGFNVTYKDKEVELPITYTIADDEKGSLVEFVQQDILGEHFNVNDFFGKRWFDEKGMPTKTLYEDAYYFRNKDKVHQKFVNEAISKMQDHQLKVRSNINVSSQPQGTFNPQTQSEFDKLASHIWANA